MKRVFLSLVCAGSCYVCASYGAIDGVGVELGRSYPHAANLARVHVLKDWRSWMLGSRLRLLAYWEGELGYWDNTSDDAPSADVWDLGITPILQLQPQAQGSVWAYVEIGSGAHLISEKRVTQRRELGGHFQFGSHLGLGVRFGDHGRYDVALRIQHISNARLKSPNDGINFASLRFAYRF
jgi:lipid A 3-O-deacylase